MLHRLCDLSHLKRVVDLITDTVQAVIFIISIPLQKDQPFLSIKTSACLNIFKHQGRNSSSAVYCIRFILYIIDQLVAAGCEDNDR